MINKIVPCVWLTTDGGHLSNVVAYYKNVFGGHFGSGPIIPLGQTPSGNAEMCSVEIFGYTFSLMCTEREHHPLNDAVSFMIHCDGQNEIDHYWDYFTREGKGSQCGWCMDKFGLRWQIIPRNLSELMKKFGSWEIMMKQKKIIIQEFLT